MYSRSDLFSYLGCCAINARLDSFLSWITKKVPKRPPKLYKYHVLLFEKWSRGEKRKRGETEGNYGGSRPVLLFVILKPELLNL
jgi:hypothetical protein